MKLTDRRPRVQRLALAPLLLGLALTLLPAPATAQAGGEGATNAAERAGVAKKRSGRTYYVSPSGSDSGPGTLQQPLRTLGAVSGLALGPGDVVRLERGGTYAGFLDIRDSGQPGAPIKLGDYGWAERRRARLTGSCLALSGSWIEVRRLHVSGCTTGIRSLGYRNEIRNVLATGNMHGIEIAESAVGNRVLNSKLRNNTRMAPNTPGQWDDYGAVGVVVHGDHTEVAYNLMKGQAAPSADFGTDGSAVEIYGGIGTRVHDNVGKDNRAFTELGNPRTSDTVYENNRAISSVPFAEFLITRGEGDYFGPVAGTLAIGNSALLTAGGSQGFYCAGTCTPSTLTIIGNDFDVAGRIGYVAGQIGGRDNTYWGGSVEHPMLPGDRWENPNLSRR